MKSCIPSLTIVSLLAVLLASRATRAKGNFGDDLEFLQQHHEDLVVLRSEDESQQVAIVPAYQGRVMSSTSNGPAGKSYGWINYELISQGEFVEQINVFGGEDRFWLGPEGGQYSIFFDQGSDFVFEDWSTPAPLDTEPFNLMERDFSSASFLKQTKLSNYSGFSFDIEIKRTVSILDRSKVEENLNIELADGIKHIGFQSVNELKNIGPTAWKKETGLLSIWILGMFKPSNKTSVIVPYKNSLKLKDDYFGKVPEDRLTKSESAVLFKGDGKLRGKIGLPPENTIPVLGSYDAEDKVLTIVEFTFAGETDYVNSAWELQEEPYAGDVVNSYNDGPLEDGSQLGPFYELESSSSARALQPSESITHTHKTYHFEGTFEDLNKISMSVLGVDLNDIHYSTGE